MFACSTRHGLIPNRLGSQPRYNSRDAPWWFIRAVGEYIQFTNDSAILKEQVKMRFLSDNEHEHHEKLSKGESKTMLLEEIIQDIVEQHAKGIRFHEWGAGEKLDPYLKYAGFNIDLLLEEHTGFIVGGSLSNCLTWMDTVGSSEKAGNKGIPAAPR